MSEDPNELRERQRAWIARHADLMRQDVPTADLRHIARLVADTMAVAWHARSHRVGATVADDVAPVEGPSPLWGGEGGRAPMDAAFLNGCAAEVLDFQEVLIDGRNNGHAAVVIVPALSALAVAHGVDGERFARALRVAFVANIGLARALGRGHRIPGAAGTPGFRTTSVASPIAAALAGALMLSDDTSVAGHAVAISAANLPAGLLAAMAPATGDFSMDKDISVGLSARHVVHAVQLATNGVTGPSAVLAGPRGWLASFGFGTQDAAYLDADLAEADLAAYTIKLFPANFGCQCAIRLAIDIAREVAATDIERVTVRVKSSSAQSLAARNLTTHAAARFSLAYATASALVRGRAILADYEPEGFRDPAVKAMMDRVEVTGDDNLEARHHAEGIFPARIEIALHDGRTVESSIDRPFDRMDDAAIDAFFGSKIKDLCEKPVADWLLRICTRAEPGAFAGFLSPPIRATTPPTVSSKGREGS